jgi:hypothetical protein
MNLFGRGKCVGCKKSFTPDNDKYYQKDAVSYYC